MAAAVDAVVSPSPLRAKLSTAIYIHRKLAPFSFRVILVGDPETGKTTFVEKLLFRAEQALYFPSVLDIYSATGSIEFVKAVGAFSHKRYSLTLIDTSGA
jgi:GTPase SAR1 family protein